MVVSLTGRGKRAKRGIRVIHAFYPKEVWVELYVKVIEKMTLIRAWRG